MGDRGELTQFDESFVGRSGRGRGSGIDCVNVNIIIVGVWMIRLLGQVNLDNGPRGRVDGGGAVVPPAVFGPRST